MLELFLDLADVEFGLLRYEVDLADLFALKAFGFYVLGIVDFLALLDLFLLLDRKFGEKSAC